MLNKINNNTAAQAFKAISVTGKCRKAYPCVQNLLKDIENRQTGKNKARLLGKTVYIKDAVNTGDEAYKTELSLQRGLEQTCEACAVSRGCSKFELQYLDPTKFKDLLKTVFKK